MENEDYYVRAAFDIFDPASFGGRHRWHGVRQSYGVDPDPQKNTFIAQKGPLKDYLGDGQVKRCPKIVQFVKDGAKNAFEVGCGGYGYNSFGVGSRTSIEGFNDKAMRTSMKTTGIRLPSETVMFTDTAFVQGFPNQYLIEYSFCEPPYWFFPDGAGGTIMSRPSPSIHFRHFQKTNVLWSDGHASAEPFAFSTLDPQVLINFNIGWFNPLDNRKFNAR